MGCKLERRVWAANACLADSLLQALMRVGVVRLPFDVAELEFTEWREEACVAARAFVCGHEDMALRPAQRDPLGNEMPTSRASALIELFQA